MASDLKANSNIVYLVGAGFSNAITDGKAPLTEKLGELLKDTFPEDIRRKFNFSLENIELFFTKLDLEILHLKRVKQDYSRLEEIRRNASLEIVNILTTKQLFCIENAKIKISDSANKICKVFFRKNDTILTVNYDCALENILSAQDKWSTIGGWGKDFRFNQDTENRDQKQNIEIFKLHGSINFVLVANLNGNEFDYNNPQLKWRTDKELFPNSLGETGWQEEIKEYIILPSYLKHFEDPKIVSLWKEAVSSVHEADKIVIIGCALREEDYLLRFLLSFVNQSSKIIIIDPLANSIKDRLIKAVPNPSNVDSINTKIEDITDDIVNNIYNHK
jgi:hypothetical protein